MRRCARSGGLLAVLTMGAAAASGGCNVVVGVGDYTVADGGSGADSTSTADSPAGDDASGAEAAACTKVTMMPLPSQGGAGCPQDSDGSTCWPHSSTNSPQR